LISLICFLLINIAGIKPPGIVWGTGNSRERTSYVVYSYLESHPFRNAGMFWEPGAFAGVITLCLALNLNIISELWMNHKWKVITIALALVTTQSTTGYIVFFILVTYYLVFYKKYQTTGLFIFPIFLLGGYYLYMNTDFLHDKIQKQDENAVTVYEDDFRNSRLGAMLFDLHYINKHPIIGNGFHISTRYEDHPYLLLIMNEGEDLGHGNGFSNYLASMGIPFMIGYLCLIFASMVKVDKKFAFLIVSIVFLNLQGEQWLNF